MVKTLPAKKFNIAYLESRTIVVNYLLEDGSHMWFPATIMLRATGRKKTFAVQYQHETIYRDENLTRRNYGGFWVLLVEAEDA